MKSQNCDCQNCKGIKSSVCLHSGWFYSLDPCFFFKAASCHLKVHDTLPTLAAKLDEILQVAKEAEKLTSFYSSCRNLLVSGYGVAGG